MPDAFDAPLPGRIASWDIPVVLRGLTLPAIPNSIILGNDQAIKDAIILGRDVDTKQEVTVTPEQLASGCYILGVQGGGKSTLLEQIAGQLLKRGESVIVFDPHGQLIDNLIRSMPRERVADTYHLDLKDREYPFGLDVFACADPADEEERDRTRHQVSHAFEKLWPDPHRGVLQEAAAACDHLVGRESAAGPWPISPGCCAMTSSASGSAGGWPTWAAATSGGMTMARCHLLAG